jgi:hypothetical protein
MAPMTRRPPEDARGLRFSVLESAVCFISTFQHPHFANFPPYIGAVSKWCLIGNCRQLQLQLELKIQLQLHQIGPW